MRLNLKPVLISTFSPPALACIRSWGAGGMRPGLICIRSEHEAPPASRFLADWTALPSRMLFKEEGIRIVSGFLKSFRADGVMAVNEQVSCWINDHRRRLPENTALWMADNETFGNILSKKMQTAVAEAAGLDVLPTYMLSKTEDVNGLTPEVFPLCLRPSKPGSVTPPFKVRIFRSSRQLVRFLRSIRDIREPMIAQPFLRLPNLVVHGARDAAGNTFGLEGFLVERKFEGVTLTIRPFPIGEDLRKKCTAFTDAFHLIGNYHFEFLHDPATGKNWFLEINNRFGGTTAKVAACGYDEPRFALKAFQSGNVRSRTGVNKVSASSSLALIKYMLYALAGRLTPLDYPDDENRTQKILHAFQSLIFCRDDVFAWKDLKGSAAMYSGNLFAKIRG